MKFNPTRINLSDLIIVNASHLSSVSLGSTFQVNKNVSEKLNQAFGQQFSDGSVQFINASEIIDDDILDFFGTKQSNIE